MMKYSADMHIHSCLSPCAEDDMTPNNIVNMALIKGLDLIAVSDHNSAKNLPAIFQVAEKAGVTVVPAMELTTREEVHILSYFPSLQSALECGEKIANFLLPLPNKPRLFGNQLIMDSEDKIIGHEERLLSQALELSTEDLFELVRSFGGVPVPAHIYRPSNGIICNLGFINPLLNVTCIELSFHGENTSNDLTEYTILRSSDAHQLGYILEQTSPIMLESCSIEAFLFHIQTPLK